jgi:hypothetical protein
MHDTTLSPGQPSIASFHLEQSGQGSKVSDEFINRKQMLTNMCTFVQSKRGYTLILLLLTT